MSKYTLAKAQLEQLLDESSNQGIKQGDVIEALIVLAIQESIKLRGAEDTRSYLEYEVSSIGSGGVHEIQRR